MTIFRASLNTCFALSLGIIGLSFRGFAGELSNSVVHEQAGMISSEEAPMTLESFRSLGDGSVFDRLKAGQRRVCFSIVDGDLSYERVQTRKFVKAYTDWLGRVKAKEKQVEQIERVFRCPAPACDYEQLLGYYHLNNTDWCKVLKHLINEHGWYIRTIYTPSVYGIVHCIDTQGPGDAHLPDDAGQVTR